MKAKDIKALLADVPDDYEVMVTDLEILLPEDVEKMETDGTEIELNEEAVIRQDYPIADVGIDHKYQEVLILLQVDDGEISFSEPEPEPEPN